MDVSLFAVSGSLAVYLPKRVFGYQSRTEQMSMAAAIGLSLGLFSLSILEAAPNTWLMLVTLDGSSESPKFFGIKISMLYWLMLWMLSIIILVVFPCLAGMALGQSFGNIFRIGNDERQFRAWTKAWMSCPFCVRCSFRTLFFGLQSIWRLLNMVLSCRSQRAPDPIMAKSFSQDELRRSSSTDLEFQALVQPPTQAQRTTLTQRILGAIGSLVGVTIVFLLCGLVSPYVVIMDSDKGYLSIVISWLCAVGLMISSLLNGFGSVSYPYSCLAGLYLKPVRPEVFTKMETELQSLRDAATKKRNELKEMKVTIESGNTGQKGKNSVLSHFTSKVSTFSELGEGIINRRQVLQNEIDFLDSLAKEMKDELDDLRIWQIKATKARTTEGRMYSYVGLVFSIILLVRLGSIALHVGQKYLETEDSSHHRSSQNDMVTSALLWLTGRDIVSKSEYAMISQGVSLGLTAVLSFSQIRKFLQVVGVVHKKWIQVYQKCYCMTPSTSMASSNDERRGFGTVAEVFFSQVFAGATGCYFLSCIVLLKMMVPEEFCVGFANALGGREVFTIHQGFVNRVFAWSAGVTLFVLAMVFGIQRQNNSRHTSSRPEGQTVVGGENV